MGQQVGVVVFDGVFDCIQKLIDSFLQEINMKICMFVASHSLILIHQQERKKERKN